MTNETAVYLSRSQEDTVWLAVIVSESIVIVIINAFTLIAFSRSRQLRKRSTYLVINLTVADLMIGLVTAPLDIYYREMGYGAPFSWQYFSASIPFNTFPMSSLVNLCLLSLERLHATLYAFAHCLINERFYFKTIIYCWLLALLIATAQTILYLYSAEGSFYLWVSLIVLTLLILTVSYAIMIVKIKSTSPAHHSGAVASDRKLSVTLFIVTALSILTILPYAIYNVIPIYMWNKLSTAEQFHIRLSVYILYYGCSLVNPVIYAIRMQEFRKAVYKQLICRQDVNLRRVEPMARHAE